MSVSGTGLGPVQVQSIPVYNNLTLRLAVRELPDVASAAMACRRWNGAAWARRVETRSAAYVLHGTHLTRRTHERTEGVQQAVSPRQQDSPWGVSLQSACVTRAGFTGRSGGGLETDLVCSAGVLGVAWMCWRESASARCKLCSVHCSSG